MEGKVIIVSIGFVGHCSLDALPHIKQIVETIPDFKLVFFKTTSSKLWIKEAEYEDE